MKLHTKTLLAAFTASAALAAGSAHAAIIGFEAESGTLGADFDPAQADLDALGGTYITTETDGSGDSPGTDARTVSYSLNVAAGTYDVYVRARVGAGGATDDSLFLAKAFGDADATVIAEWHKINGAGAWVGGYPATAPDFGWGQVNGLTVTSAGGAVTWEIGAREDGFDVDAFALVSTGQSVTDNDLDNAVIPEPGSFALLGLGGLLIGARRRRG